MKPQGASFMYAPQERKACGVVFDVKLSFHVVGFTL